ncbi:TPA: phage protein Gp36 family protein [Escherichia coli]
MRYRDAIRFLEKVAAGQINLGRDTSGSVIQSSSQVRNGLHVFAGRIDMIL